MTAAERLERLVEESLHSVILECATDLPSVYSKCVESLHNLEKAVEASSVPLGVMHSHVVRIRTHLALMASEVGDYGEAERLATNVSLLASKESPDFALAASIRVSALHCLGRHQEEVRTALEYIEGGVLKESLLIYVLGKLARHHGEMITWTSSLVSLLKAYVSESPELARRLQDPNQSVEDPMGYAIAVAEVAQQINREETERALKM